MRNVYSVKQVNAYIKNMFTQDFMLNRIYIKGEVSNCKYHCANENYCTKNVIKVGSCNCDPKNVDATCCQSFEMKAY